MVLLYIVRRSDTTALCRVKMISTFGIKLINPSVLTRTLVVGPHLASQLHTTPATCRQKGTRGTIMFLDEDIL